MSAEKQAKEIKELLKQNSRNLSANEDATRLDKIRRIFQKLAPEMTVNESSSQSQIKWSKWLHKHHTVFLNQLCHCVRPIENDNHHAGKLYALRVFFGVMAYFHHSISFIDENVMYRLVSALCGSDILLLDKDTEKEISIGFIDESMLQMLRTEFILPYHDVRYFMLIAATRLAKDAISFGRNDDSQHKNATENIMRLLLSITISSEEDDLMDKDSFLVTPSEETGDNESSSEESSDDDSDEDNSDIDSEIENGKRSMKSQKRSSKRQRQSSLSTVQRLSRHRRVLGLAWVEALKMSHIQPATHKRVLQFLSTEVIPNIHSPLTLADYFTESYEYGGVTSLLALHGLFQLMTEYGLEYPEFYSSLYSLIDSQAFYAKHRGRFFKLLSVCLSSTLMLPAYVVAAFCKRLSRTALTAPPSGALFVLALISNLLRKHKTCRVLIYRDEENSLPMNDPYDATTNDPAESRGE